MEVAGQWRREWAGAAEYGKVTEGGVTRQVARAMEVLHASAPGARMRVMRAAYHSTAGPGAATSYMVHSSRRVISSGTRLLSPSLTNRPFGDTPSLPSLPSLPLEISSTPLELVDTPEAENYKVTEPDDTEISQPSKWKSSTSKSSVRMPSEESSSTDNASIIDLDPKPHHRSIFRKYSYDSENSDISTMKLSSRASPLLDAPISLSTLKYKSLLNGSNDWTNRRKSYSFEETDPLNETISHCNDTLAMESSTDSGICKSTEIVNDHADYERKDRKYYPPEDSFKDWLNKSRQTSFNKTNQYISNNRGHNVVIEEPSESSITLQSAGKVSITVPITLESEEDYQHRKAQGLEEAERRRKKVEFCKTELHFAAESGKVNIIATDEKPPPTNDFRRRKSAFVPMKKPERPTTLLLEKKTTDDTMVDLLQHNTSEVVENDENTAATKSILKNKIPKPKPYLLGENMALGLADDVRSAKKSSTCNEHSDVPTAVSLINRQLQERRCSNETTSSMTSETDISSPLKTFTSRPINAGLIKSVSSKSQHTSQQYSSTSEVTDTFNSVKEKLKALQASPTPARSKTRQLRQSDLTYFGIQNDKNNTEDDKPKFIRDRIKMQNEAIDNIFQSVRLIQQVSNSVSNSVCHSEAESEDAVEYQNIPLKTNFAPIPTPRSRTKYTDRDSEKVTVLKPIVEQDSVVIKQQTQDSTRRSRSRRYEEVSSPAIRSISEPPKANRLSSLEKSHRRTHHIKQNVSARINKYGTEEEQTNYIENHPSDTAKLYLSEEDDYEAVPTYVNINKELCNNATPINSEDKICKPEIGIKSRQSHKTDTDHREIVQKADKYAVERRTRTRHEKAETDIKPTESHKADQYESNRKSRATHEMTSKGHQETTRSQTNSREKIQKADKQNDSLNRNTNSSRKKKDLKTVATPSDIPQSSGPSENSQSNTTTESKRNKEERSTSTSRQTESLRRADKNITERTAEVSDTPSKDSKVSKSQHVRSGSRHSTSKKDTVENHKRSSANSADRHRNSLQLKSGERNGEVHYSKDRKSRRNEYVINYDDKNGTVASITKVSTGPGSTRKKKASLERIKDTPKEYRIQSKPEKLHLLPRTRDPKRTESRA
ncbi:uncharacterized protein LOC125227915 isoform X2 [Leguminivora glycinivorella]|uniref:uncharacterized protein LOC125227915 isoform X2 n=1 Tax=Leguminivora glycinivorella TaxID=1035111 RepID=UPI00200D5D75|nr:uncharacterized protein LOC125227915 isoform X2 [Leguminivora glycinivorella]